MAAEAPPSRCVADEEKVTITAAVESIATCLQSHTPEWTDRLAALTQLQGLLNSDFVREEFFVALLSSVQGPLCVQLEDRRSALCKEVCSTIVLLATKLQDNFEQFAQVYLQALSKLLVVTIKAIAEPGHASILSLLPYSSSTVPTLVQGTKDKHPVLRARCIEYLCKVVENNSPARLEEFLGVITEGTKSAVTDSSADARAFGKRCYQAIAKNWPETAKSLLSSLEPSVQKRLQTEAAPTKKPATGGFKQFMMKKGTQDTAPVVVVKAVDEAAANAEAIIVPSEASDVAPKCDIAIVDTPLPSVLAIVDTPVDVTPIGTTLDVCVTVNTTHPPIEVTTGNSATPDMPPIESPTIIQANADTIDHAVIESPAIAITASTIPLNSDTEETTAPAAIITKETAVDAAPIELPQPEEAVVSTSEDSEKENATEVDSTLESGSVDSVESQEHPTDEDSEVSAVVSAEPIEPSLSDSEFVEQQPEAATEAAIPEATSTPVKTKKTTTKTVPKRKLGATAFEDKENSNNITPTTTPQKSLPALSIVGTALQLQPAAKKTKHSYLLEFQPGSTPIALRVKSRSRTAASASTTTTTATATTQRRAASSASTTTATTQRRTTKKAL